MMRRLSSIIFSLFATLLMLAGCARNLDSNTYVSSATSGKVLEGTVISAQPVKVKGSDRLDQNTLGMLGGGALGGVAGSALGKGTGNSLAVVGGAIAGAAAGAFAQDVLQTSDGIQYIVRLDPKYISQNPAKYSSSLSISKNTVDKEVQSSASLKDTQTDLMSVLQGKDNIIPVGKRVLVIINEDRIRLTPES